MSNSEEAVEFRKYIRSYNNNFSFTSLGGKYDRDLYKRNRGIHTFRVQGQVYHFINYLMPSNNYPSYLQLYFYDSEHEMENRLRMSNKMNSSILEKLIAILKINLFCTFFRTLKDVATLESCKIFLKCNVGFDQRVYNTPLTSEVA